MLEIFAASAARAASALLPAPPAQPASTWPWVAAAAILAAAGGLLWAKRHSRHVQVPLLRALLAIGRDEDGWRRVGRLTVNDAKGVKVSEFAIDARHSDGRYAEVRSSRKGEAPSHFKALYAGGALHFTVEELRALRSLGPRAGRARIAMPLTRKPRNWKAVADIDVKAMLKEAVEGIKREFQRERRKAGQAKEKAGRGTLPPEHQSLKDAVSSIRDTGTRKQAASIANQAVSAVGAKAAKAARIAAARLLHPDATPAGDADAAAKTRALAAINAILDKAEAA